MDGAVIALTDGADGMTERAKVILTMGAVGSVDMTGHMATVCIVMAVIGTVTLVT